LCRLRLHIIATPTGLSVGFALASPRDGERDVLSQLLGIDRSAPAGRQGPAVMAERAAVPTSSKQRWQKWV